MTERVEDLVAQLQGIEETLRDLAYDQLRDAAEGNTDAVAAEKKLQQARRAVERAVRALGGQPGDW